MFFVLIYVFLRRFSCPSGKQVQSQLPTEICRCLSIKKAVLLFHSSNLQWFRGAVTVPWVKGIKRIVVRSF